MLRHSRSSLVFMLIAFALAISARPAEGQTISFLRQFSAPGITGASAVAADASGVYVFGNGQNSAGARKYDARSNELWTREFSAPEGLRVFFRGAAVDATGVYVVGTTYNPPGPVGAFVRKYGASGNELWTRQFDPSASTYANAVAADATGIYVVGGTFNPPAAAFVRKYDAGGNELWTRQFGETTNDFPQRRGGGCQRRLRRRPFAGPTPPLLA